MTLRRLVATMVPMLLLSAVASLVVGAQTPVAGRDPFLPLVAPAPSTEAPASSSPSRGRRLVDVSLATLTLKGIVTSAGFSCALVAEPDGRTWVVREGDRLKDGVVRRVGRTEVEVGGVDGGGVLLTLGGGK